MVNDTETMELRAEEPRGDGRVVLSALVPRRARGRWCRFLAPAAPQRSVLRLAILTGRGEVCSESYLHPHVHGSRAAAAGVLFVCANAARVRLRLFSALPAWDLSFPLRCTPLPRAVIAARAGLTHPLAFGRITVGWLKTGWPGLGARLRNEIAARANGAGRARSYDLWIRMFERAPPAMGRNEPSGIAAIVCHAGEGSDPHLRASLDALEASPAAMACHVVGPEFASLADVLRTSQAAHFALLQAGEIPAPWALASLAGAAPDGTAIAYADEDRLSPSGKRVAPFFKPQPSRLLMLSGVLTRGIWLVRRELLGGEDAEEHEAWAEALRLAAWLKLWESGDAASCCRVPEVLTHRLPGTRAAPAALLGAIVRDHARRTEFPVHAEPSFPLRLTVRAAHDAQPKVDVIVLSAGGPQAASCIRRILEGTAYRSFTATLVFSTRRPLGPRFRRLIDAFGGHPAVRWTTTETTDFNFSRAVNHAAGQAEGGFLCLLNDDVAPIGRGWLAAMVGHMADAHIGIVGPRLYYPDRTVQHAGIVMRPSGDGEHVYRFLRKGAPGYAGRAALDQEYSAVTGACMLIRRTVFEALGGLDETYPTTFGDVDFCLRARERGWGVALAAGAELWHCETRSVPRERGPEAARRKSALRARIRERFPGICEDDPFYNPNLSTLHGDTWNLAFPPQRARAGSVQDTELHARALRERSRAMDCNDLSSPSE